MNLKYWSVVFRERSGRFFGLLTQGDFPRAKNYLLTNLNMIRQPEQTNNYPTTLVIDPGNICNLSCSFCITGQKKSHRQPKLLTFTDFKKIIDQLGKWAIQLDLYNWGEPLLNPEIFKMISYAKKVGLSVDISSNLLLLTPKMAKKLVQSGLNRLIVSLPGTSQRTIQIFINNGNFGQVIANLKLLTNLKKQLQSQTPSIIWRLVVSRYNESELGMAKNLAREIGIDYFEPVPLQLNTGCDPEEVIAAIKKQAHWLPKNKKYRYYDAKTQKKIIKPLNCYWPWEIIAINADGTVQPCCVFSNPKFDFGNILKNPFQKIWNGEKYQLARKTVREKIKTDVSTICGRCLSAGFIGE